MIRVLLANHPAMIPDAIRQLLDEQEDMEVVGDVRGPMKILQEVGRTQADAVILVQEGVDEPGLCSQLLAVYPDVTILCLRGDRGAFTRQLCSQRRDIVDVENESIVRAFRTIVRERCRETEN
jgi:DNA-binding NarL/FixJ family response regulator